jgi:hypothetical protein
VQLLQVLVGDASHPRLETLFVLPSPKVQARSDLPIPGQSIDDTFAVMDNDSGELVMIHIPSAVDAFRGDTPIPTTRWVSRDMFGNYSVSLRPHFTSVSPLSLYSTCHTPKWCASSHQTCSWYASITRILDSSVSDPVLLHPRST